MGLRYLKMIIPFFIVVLVILGFNFLSIFGLHGLIIDDQGYYFSLFDKTVNDLHFRRNIFHALFTLGIMKLAFISSIYFARLVIIIFLIFPSAWLIYYLTRRYLYLPVKASIAIAVLPFILPGEMQVPTYMVGSYMVPALLAALISVFFILRYIHEKKSIWGFSLAIAFYYIATESSELFAIMLPAFLFLVFIPWKFSWHRLALGAIISFIAVRKTILVLNNPYGKINSVENDLAPNEIIYRIVHFTDVFNPFSGNLASLLGSLFIGSLILSAIIIILRNPERSLSFLDKGKDNENSTGKYAGLLYYYFFPILWTGTAAFPFLFFSQSFTSRYMLVPSVGLGFLIIMSLGVLTGMFAYGKRTLLILSVLVILSAGISRQSNFLRFYKYHKDQFRELSTLLKHVTFPDKAQIVATSFSNHGLKLGHGVTNNSIGTYEFILQRRDITGQVMKEKCFYDPFKIHRQPYVYRNVDLDTTKSTFLFRFYNKDTSENRRLYYALRWEDEESRDSRWSLFHFDDYGGKSTLLSGNGYKAYREAMDSLSAFGIERNDIMFGGLPDRQDSLRLGLKNQIKTE